ncbi:hypothetical protein GCM10009819_02850 [Agromyces tropicus]|uniref:KAP NTPase domain-containing protein n=1 Tax=Agromyces tropicus TaxID=555371 RepID=A0ABP5FFN4_9MICO
MAESDSHDFDLGRAPLASAQARQVVERLLSHRESATFALVGEWGSGKTWLLDALLNDLTKNPDWVTTRCTVVYFNPWYYADEQALFAGFASLLVQQTLKKGRARARLAGLLKLVGPSAKFGTVDLTAVVNQVGTALESTTPSRIRDAITGGLAKSGRRLLIVMDDLDRLNPDELLILFKLVRLVGDVPGLNYLLAYDEDTLHHLLKQTAIAAGSSERARRYLEKIVERRWEVPPLTDAQLDEILFARLSLREGDPSDPGVGYRLESLIRAVVTTPRAAERYVNLANSIPERVRDELHQGDLHLTLFLRVAAPTLWKAIIQERQLLVVGGQYLIDSDRKEHAEAALERFRAATGDLAFGPDLLDLVVDSFPSFAHALDPKNTRSADAPRIGHSDFVDHYLWLDLPPGSISETAVTSALRRLPDDAAEREIRDLLLDSPRLTLDSIWRNTRADGVSRPQVFMLFERLYGTHGVTATFGVFATSVDRRIFSIANDLLTQMSAEELSELVIAPNYGNRPLLVELSARLRARPETGADVLNNFVTEITRPIASTLTGRLESARTPAFPESSTRDDLRMLFELDSDSARSLVQRRLESRAWREDDVGSVYVGLQLSTSAGYRWYIDVQRMRANLGDELAARVENAIRTSNEEDVAADILAQVPAGERPPTAEEGRMLTRFLLARERRETSHEEE